jgi:hypothetical protein
MIDSNVYEYFKHFQNKDITSLSDMFSESVYLQDWESTSIGKHQVLEANERLFSLVDNIVIEVINLVTKDNIAIAEMTIQIAVQETVNTINVVDVIEFDNSDLIASVKAYKR